MVKRMLQGSAESRKWWRSRVAAYKETHFAQAITDLSPKKADVVCVGRCFSVAFEQGIRHYFFEQQSDRDRFLTNFRKVYSAKPCGNPCP